MSIRTNYYLVCTACNNQFMSRKYGNYFYSPEEAKECAVASGYHVDIEVFNGSLWDFCPACWENRESNE